jgi:hypothetical protein
LLGVEDPVAAREPRGALAIVVSGVVCVLLEFDLFVEDYEARLLALADLVSGSLHLPVRPPDRGGVALELCLDPQRHDIDSTIALLGFDVDRSRERACRAMPGELELSGSLLDRLDEAVGDFLVNVDSLCHVSYPWPCRRPTCRTPSAAKAQSGLCDGGAPRRENEQGRDPFRI